MVCGSFSLIINQLPQIRLHAQFTKYISHSQRLVYLPKVTEWFVAVNKELKLSDEVHQVPIAAG